MPPVFTIPAIPDFPLQLARLDFDPKHGHGYNMRDTNFVLAHTARAIKAGYLDTLDLLQKNDRTHTIENYMTATEEPVLVTGEVFYYPGQAGGYQVMDVLLGLLRQTQQADLGPKRVIMPLNVAFAPTGDKPAKDDHAMVLLIEEHPQQAGKYRIAILEQHARRDGSKLDYSKEKAALRDHLRAFYPDAEFMENQKPFCTEERVCGIASLAVCKKLVSAKDAFAVACDDGQLHMSAADVAGEHADNVRLARRDAAVTPPGADTTGTPGGRTGKT